MGYRSKPRHQYSSTRKSRNKINVGKKKTKWIPQELHPPDIFRYYECTNCGWEGSLNVGLRPSGHARNPFCPKCGERLSYVSPIEAKGRIGEVPV